LREGLRLLGGRGRRLLLIFVSDPFLACDSLGPPLVELLGTNVDLLREKNLFRELKSVDAAPRLSILIVVLLRFGRRARRGLSVVWLFDEEEPQGFFDNGFLVRELAVLDLFSEPPLKIICKSDVHHGEPCQSRWLQIAHCVIPSPSLPQKALGWQNQGLAIRGGS
jgi:hypothetical protein